MLRNLLNYCVQLDLHVILVSTILSTILVLIITSNKEETYLIPDAVESYPIPNNNPTYNV